LLAAGLAALDPDLILVQEALRSGDGRYDTLGTLADRLGLHQSYAPARRKLREVDGEVVDTWSSPGILSRETPDSIEAIQLPRDDRDGERVAMIARFGDLAIVNLHLTHLRDDPALLLRRRQLDVLFAADSLNSARRAVVGGDFNTRLELIDGLISGIGDWGLIDAFGEQTEQRATAPVDWPSDRGFCIDYIFAMIKPGWAPPHFRDSRVVLAGADENGIYPSDHRGVMTTIDYRHERDKH
jgi:endonuclease/exonuclease/phosphatase family metal-dependent hydrolase